MPGPSNDLISDFSVEKEALCDALHEISHHLSGFYECHVIYHIPVFFNMYAIQKFNDTNAANNSQLALNDV